MTSASKTSMISFSSVDINDFHELGSFESRHYELSNLISKLDVNMSVDAVILNYNFKVTCIIQIDNSSYNVSIFERLSWRTVLPSDKKASQLCGEMDLYTAKYSNYPTEPCCMYQSFFPVRQFLKIKFVFVVNSVIENNF